MRKASHIVCLHPTKVDSRFVFLIPGVLRFRALLAAGQFDFSFFFLLLQGRKHRIAPIRLSLVFLLVVIVLAGQSLTSVVRCDHRYTCSLRPKRVHYFWTKSACSFHWHVGEQVCISYEWVDRFILRAWTHFRRELRLCVLVP